jgi:ABC-type glycerol-3-phosphate transport system substrate-binding protein
MNRLGTLKLFAGLLAITMLLAACGGGEVASQAAGPSSSSYMLSWDAPDTTIDNTAIDPYEELDHYEIYVSEDMIFTEEDAPAAVVSAVEDILSDYGQIGKELVSDFDLALLQGLPSANQLYVTLRAVGIDGQKSDFMEPVIWTRS